MSFFGEFSDELAKLAGVDLDLKGYQAAAANKIQERHELMKQLQPVPGKRPDKMWANRLWNKELDLSEKIDDLRRTTPFDRQTGARASTFDVLQASGRIKKWQDRMTDEAYDEKPSSYMLNMKELRELKQDYEQGLKDPKRYRGQTNPQPLDHERAFLKQVDHLIKDPKTRFARLEWG